MTKRQRRKKRTQNFNPKVENRDKTNKQARKQDGLNLQTDRKTSTTNKAKQIHKVRSLYSKLNP